MRSFFFLVFVFSLIEIFAHRVDGELDILKRHQQLQELGNSRSPNYQVHKETNENEQVNQGSAQTCDNGHKLNEILSLLKDMKRPCSDAPSSSTNDRLERVEDAILSIRAELLDVKDDSASKYNALSNNLDAANSDYRELRRLVDDLQETPGKRIGKSGTTYIRWGRNSCPSGTEILYHGYAGGSWFKDQGAAVSMLCLPRDPEWQMHNDGENMNSGFVHGAEYEPDPRLYQFFGKNLGEQDVPCAVCNSRQSSSSIMIPGKKTCHDGWNVEYSGYLMSGHYNHAAATDYYCIDKDAEALPGGAKNENGKLLYFVEVRCTSLECPPYKSGWELACVVCSK